MIDTEAFLDKKTDSTDKRHVLGRFGQLTGEFIMSTSVTNDLTSIFFLFFLIIQYLRGGKILKEPKSDVKSLTTFRGVVLLGLLTFIFKLLVCFPKKLLKYKFLIHERS